MSGTSTWLADHMASLLPKTVSTFLPKTTAGACIPASPWTSNRTTCNQATWCCDSSRSCRYSCHGKAECTGWNKYFCY
jgi:hypothetical protein